MVECDKCGISFNADEIENCPKCDKELCPDCYNKHVGKCMLKGKFED